VSSRLHNILIEIKRTQERKERGGREFKKFLGASKIFFLGMNNRREREFIYFILFENLFFKTIKMNARI
jgi:hypothetical protein